MSGGGWFVYFCVRVCVCVYVCDSGGWCGMVECNSIKSIIVVIRRFDPAVTGRRT